MPRVIWRNFDFWLIGVVLILTIFGVTMIRSTVAGNIQLTALNLVQRQLIYAVVGIIAAVVVASIDYHFWVSVNRFMYWFMFIALAALFIIGAAVFGSARWFDVGLVFIQPSEFVKIVIILVLADFFSRNQDRLGDIRWVFRSFIITLGLTIWILLQPNLSTSIVIFVIWFTLLWMSGLRLKHMLYAAGVILIIAIVLAVLLLSVNPYDIAKQTGIIQPYQLDRIRNFLFPDPEASYGESYNVNQALITIGSGGLLGQGYGQGTQVQLRFLKVRWSDFIFAALAEEFGFIGVIVIMLLEFFVILRCIRAARIARDTYGALIAYGAASLIAFQGVVNMGMNLNLLPVTGLPLPFVSYGGSSLLSMLLCIGLVESVNLWQKALEF
jgi:rod shape determining protein RodA